MQAGVDSAVLCDTWALSVAGWCCGVMDCTTVQQCGPADNADAPVRLLLVFLSLL